MATDCVAYIDKELEDAIYAMRRYEEYQRCSKSEIVHQLIKAGVEACTNVFPWEDKEPLENGEEWYHRMRLLWYQMRTATKNGQNGPEGVAQWYRAIYGDDASRMMDVLEEEAKLFIAEIRNYLNPDR